MSLVDNLLGLFGLSNTPVNSDYATKLNQSINQQYSNAAKKGVSIEGYSTPTPTNPPKKSVLSAQYTPQTKLNQQQLQQVIQKGLSKYAPAPIATMSSQLAEAGMQLPDQLLPTLVALIETSGGRNVSRGVNNLYNVNATTGGTTYPDLQTAILGGGGQKGFLGTVKNSGYYNDYLQSGKLEDFLRHYTPPGAEHNNAGMDVQLNRYATLRKMFQ